METSYHVCGCSVSKSMFGNREIISINNCVKHAMLLQKELKELADKTQELLLKEIKTK